MSSDRVEEISAGGVVIRGEDVVVIVPTRRAANGGKVLALPKGHLDGSEDARQAATREVREETGVEGELIGELGEVRYWYKRDGRAIPKLVKFFLFHYLSGDTEDHDREVEEALWMPIEKAKTVLSYRGEREMVALAQVSEAGSAKGSETGS